METCPWINKKGEQCTKKSLSGKHYCTFHKKYEGIYDPSELASLKFCSRCSGVFTPDDTTTTQCQKCMFQKGRHRLCGWINQKGKPCPWKALHDCTYCKRHSKYEGVFTPEDIKDLKKCSGCKNMFKPTGSCKTCDKCVTRTRLTNERIRIHKQDSPKCKAIVQRTGLQCSHIVKDDSDYCGEHQSYAKWKTLTEHGMNVCNNWIRGCWNECHNGYKRCEDCRKTEREKDKKKLEKKHMIQQAEISENSTLRTCVRCSQKLHIDCFKSTNVIHTKDGTETIYCKECSECRNKNRIRDTRDRSARIETRKSTDRPDTFNKRLTVRYAMYKLRDAERGLTEKEDFETLLPKDFANNLMKMPCVYCRKPPTDECPNGLDRIDNTISHIIGNVLPCCHQCNMKKKTDSFRKDIIHSIKKVKNKRSYCITSMDHMECPV